MFRSADITVAILAGGLGKRLRSKVFDRPKVLAKVGKVPFLQKLLDQINAAGFKDVVLCTGYLGDKIKDRFGSSYKCLKIRYSHEEQLLGTAGGLRLSFPLLKSEDVLVTNGDSFFDINFKEFLAFHRKNKAGVSLALLHTSQTDRFGKVKLGTNNEITGFEEKKKGSGSGFINGGIYLIKRSLISEISPEQNLSLEKEIFPKWVGRKFYGFKCQSPFIDIGTPESYNKAQHFFRKI